MTGFTAEHYGTAGDAKSTGKKDKGKKSPFTGI